MLLLDVVVCTVQYSTFVEYYHNLIVSLGHGKVSLCELEGDNYQRELRVAGLERTSLATMRDTVPLSNMISMQHCKQSRVRVRVSDRYQHELRVSQCAPPKPKLTTLNSKTMFVDQSIATIPYIFTPCRSDPSNAFNIQFNLNNHNTSPLPTPSSKIKHPHTTLNTPIQQQRSLPRINPIRLHRQLQTPDFLPRLA